MNKTFSTLRINQDRFRSHFEALAKIGGTAEGGVHRPALSEAHLEARRWLKKQIAQAHLEIKIDGAGNHHALLGCGPQDGPGLLLGSHLDSVPNGGRFDGPLGVLAALEVLQVIKEQGLSLKVNLEAVDFTDEEDCFVSYMGSRALTGDLKRHDLQNPSKSRDLFQQALSRAGLTESGILAAARDPKTVAGYLELHIEQGNRLIEQRKDIGIVTTIVGIRSRWLKFLGRADHAGTTPVNRRRDAAQGAAAFTLAVRDLVMKDFPDSVVNVGNMEFAPAAFNVVPEAVKVALQFRADENNKLDRMEKALLEEAGRAAQRFGLRWEMAPLESIAPVDMNPKVQEAIIRACENLNLSYVMLSSGAGHDAQSMASIGPAGMIFVPSAGGFSHSPREFTEWQDCCNGANVLLHAALTLAH